MATVIPLSTVMVTIMMRSNRIRYEVRNLVSKPNVSKSANYGFGPNHEIRHMSPTTSNPGKTQYEVRDFGRETDPIGSVNPSEIADCVSEWFI